MVKWHRVNGAILCGKGNLTNLQSGHNHTKLHQCNTAEDKCQHGQGQFDQLDDRPDGAPLWGIDHYNGEQANCCQIRIDDGHCLEVHCARDVFVPVGDADHCRTEDCHAQQETHCQVEVRRQTHFNKQIDVDGYAAEQEILHLRPFD